MFTGLIAGLGQITQMVRHTHDAHIEIAHHTLFEDIIDGESIAINGCCLSVESHTASSFLVYASKETLQRTTLKDLKAGQEVNLERALALGERLGGHIVSGHIDGLAKITTIRPVGQSILVRFAIDQKLALEIIPKGSIAIDGISLTVNNCTDDSFDVNLIPDTQKRTACKLWQVGRLVNIETDLLGKYVYKALKHDPTLLATFLGPQKIAQNKPDKLSTSFLAEHGFI